MPTVSQSLTDDLRFNGKVSAAAAGTFVEVDTYEPDVSAYEKDPANDRRSQLRSSLNSATPPSMTFSVRAPDGVREVFELTPGETQAYFEANLSTRDAIKTRKIKEKRWGVAVKAATEMREKNLTADQLTPYAEICLWNFGALEEHQERIELREGGYGLPIVARLREDAFDRLREDPGVYGSDNSGGDISGYGTGYLDQEYLSYGGPSGQQLYLNDYWDMLAKCVAGTTKIPLLDGTSPTIADLAQRGGDFWVYSCNDSGHVVPGHAFEARSNGIKPVFDVLLDNGESVRVTGDHRFMLRDGTYRDAIDLTSGDRLMPLYRRYKGVPGKDYESIYHPGLGLWEKTHHLVSRHTHADDFFELELVEGKNKRHIDHINENSRDNRPENVQVLKCGDHMRKTVSHGIANAPERFKASLGKKRSPETCARMGEARRAWWSGLTEEQRAAFCQKIGDRRKAKFAEGKYDGWLERRKDPAYREKMSQSVKAAWDSGRREYRNHRVVSITAVGEEEVFDLSVDRYHNFAVGSGVFVHNCFWNWHHDPVAQEGVNIIRNFVLGRGMTITANDKKVQNFIDEFDKRENMDARWKTWTTGLSRDGNLFVRLVRQGDGTLKVRSLDAATIWEIITDAEDIEHVYYYAQRYQTRMQIFENPDGDAGHWISRDIPADELIHLKINASDAEVFGRSDLFVVLGYLKRLRDLSTTAVLKEQAQAAYVFDATIDGGPADVASFVSSALPKGKPSPGSTFAHNKAATIQVLDSGKNSGSSGQGSNFEGLLTMIAMGLGIAKDYLGVTSRGSRATALVATEPTTMRFEDRQDTLSIGVTRLYEYVIEEGRRYGYMSGVEDFSFTVSFPEIQKDDAASKIELINEGVGMQYLSHATAADMYANEMDIDDYNYEAECAKIAAEMQSKNPPLILTKYACVPMGDTATGVAGAAYDDGNAPPAAAGPPVAPGAQPPGNNPKQPAQMQPVASPASSTGAAQIRKDLGRNAPVAESWVGSYA